MKNLSGFAPYSMILALAIISLVVVIFQIKVRAEELIFYKELNKQNAASVKTLNGAAEPCAGPGKAKCKDGYKCVIPKTSSDGFGVCVIDKK